MINNNNNNNNIALKMNLNSLLPFARLMFDIVNMEGDFFSET